MKAASPAREPAEAPLALLVRCAIRVTGTVQGVGFRPYVHRLAHAMGVTGWVNNDGEGVSIEAEGQAAHVARLIEALRREAPRLARIESIDVRELLPQGGSGFAIAPSRLSVPATTVPADAATCDACLAELLDPRDRRFGYPFINCVHCGPRFTLTLGLPYDRARTTMGAFALCPDCLQEYEDPQSRRFHAEPNACPVCGPRLWSCGRDGVALADDGDPVRRAWEAIAQGRILALRGIGGFHLVCDARNAQAVALLRQRKQRDAKPFAVMVLNIASARRWAHVDNGQARVLQSPAHPIMLAERRAGSAELEGVAPGMGRLGLLLPYTPVHYLLFRAALGQPRATQWLHEECPLALVMTSANLGGEPLVRDNDEALERLAQIADMYLLHDRPIAVRCDDSVVLAGGAGGSIGSDTTPRPAVVVRRARGYAPAPIRLGRAGPCVLALGGQDKNTICLTRESQAFVSQHLGDTDNAATRRLVDEAMAHWLEILAVQPAAVACDLHPDYASSALAVRVAAERAIPLITVQHHHAHIAAVLAEHGHEGAVLGVALDGSGLGSDGAPWGGELLRVDGATSQRVSHLVALSLVGGEAAAREPWRMAGAVLHRLGRGAQIAGRYAQFPAARNLAAVLERGLQSPLTSSMGRWFDAAAAALGSCLINSYEGQAAMQLEALARHYGDAAPGGLAQPGAQIDAQGQLDLLPLVAGLLDETDAARGAARFHAGVVAGLDEWIALHAARTGLDTVALGGGCFLNANVSTGLKRRLQARGLRVLAACQVPVNDGGLSLGQAWVAQRTLPALERQAFASFAHAGRI